MVVIKRRRLTTERANGSSAATREYESEMALIDALGDDIMLNILERLPAIPFAAAATVSLNWNRLCNRILSTPKLASAISVNPSTREALAEVLDTVLSAPIRPHFVLASVTKASSLNDVFLTISMKFSPNIPVIVNVTEGILCHGEMRSSKFLEQDEEFDDDVRNSGILLTIGFLLGLKTNIVPLMTQIHYPKRRDLLMDEFVMDIEEYTSTVSDSSTPASIILFTDRIGVYSTAEMDIKPVFEKIELAFGANTCVVGDGLCEFLYRCGETSNFPESTCAGVALVFATDRNKASDIGEIQFHSVLSMGLYPIGQTYRTVSAKQNMTSTWLTASLGGNAFFEQLQNEVRDDIAFIGVAKKRNISIQDKSRKLNFLEFNDVGLSWCLYKDNLDVERSDIKKGDEFRFYTAHVDVAVSTSKKAENSLASLREERRNVFGGLIFACWKRDEDFGRDHDVAVPFRKNFPGTCYGGTFCDHEIARDSLSWPDSEDERGVGCCYLHWYGVVFFVMSYIPPLPVVANE